MLDDTRGFRHFTSKEINIVMGIATLTAIAMDSYGLRENLALARGRLEALAGATSDVIVVLDTRLRVKHLSPSGERLLGWSEDEIVGKQCAEVFKVKDLHGVGICGLGCMGRRVIWGEDVAGQSSRLNFQTKTCGQVTCDVRAAGVKDANGQVIEIVYALAQVKHSTIQSPVKDVMSNQDPKKMEQIVLDGE